MSESVRRELVEQVWADLLAMEIGNDQAQRIATRLVDLLTDRYSVSLKNAQHLCHYF